MNVIYQQENAIAHEGPGRIAAEFCGSLLGDAKSPRQKENGKRVRRSQSRPAAALLTDLEILESILANSSRCRNSKSVSQALLKKFRTFGGVITAGDLELRAVDGVGQPTITALKLVAASVDHMLKEPLIKTPVIYDSIDLERYLTARLQHERVEVFFIIYFDSRNRLIADEEMCRGTLDQVTFYTREVIRRCLELDAKSIIMAHNHPSGHIQPSREDEMSTREIDTATQLFKIILRDHVVVGNGKIFSFRSNGLI